MNNTKLCAGIAAIIGVTSLGVVALIAIFLPEQLSVAAWIVAALSLMGVSLGYLGTRGSVLKS